MQEKRDNRNSTDEIEIDLVEIFGLLMHRFWLLALSAIVCGAIAFMVSAFLVTPLYESTTKIYILNRQNGDSLTLTDAQLATQLTKDYEELVTSRTVLEDVIAEFDLTDSYKGLANRVAVSNTANTRIIAITVKDADPIMARDIANAIRDAAAKHIQAVMDIEAVNIVDDANLPDAPVSPSIPKWTLIGVMLGGVAAAGLVILRYLLDDTIKTSEDVEKYLELSTLALIPVVEGFIEDKKKGSVVKKRRRKVSDNAQSDSDIDVDSDKIIEIV
ncbi:MAG: protein-tyrosine kinase [Acetatifactor sp.]|nr:protein-tyrosine kinase [Acetatifactor sp.]